MINRHAPQKEQSEGSNLHVALRVEVPDAAKRLETYKRRIGNYPYLSSKKDGKHKGVCIPVGRDIN